MSQCFFGEEDLFSHEKKINKKTQLIKLCTKGRVKKKTIEYHNKEQNEIKERAAKMCPNALTGT